MLAALPITGAAAQPWGAPVALTPPAATGTAGQGTGAVGADAPSPPPPDPHAVAVDTLAAPKLDSLGLMDATGGGFSDSLWHGTPGDAAQALVAGLPRRYVVPAARRLAQRLSVVGGASG